MNSATTRQIRALPAAIALALGTEAAIAAFTPLPANTQFSLDITGGCFDFGNCQTSGKGVLTDNTTPNQASLAGFGSGIVGDGKMGVINLITNGAGTSFSVTSFSQDTYQGTAGGSFYLRATDISAMGGTVDGAGNMIFDPTGRLGIAASFATTLGEQPWNIDNPSTGTGTGLYDMWTTGSSTNNPKGLSGAFTVTGTPLADAGAGAWTGTLVLAGNIGTAWGSFDNTQYSELFNVTLTALPDPVAVNDTDTTTQGTPKDIDVLANDNAPSGTLDVTTVTIVDPPPGTGSSAVPNATTGVITYTPGPAVLGTESFTYTVENDSGVVSSVGKVTVTVTVAGNTDPVAVDDPLTTDEDTQAAPLDVTLNDTDADGDTLTVVSHTNPTKGSLVQNGNSFTFTPSPQINGLDSFTYTISDGNGGSAVGTVNIDIKAINDDPVANNLGPTTQVDTPLIVNVLGATSDIDGDTVTLDSFTQGASGTVTQNPDDTLTYTPDSGFQGVDSFDYTVIDGNGGSATGTVEVTVLLAAFTGPVAMNTSPQTSPDISGGSNFTMINNAGSDIGGTNDLSATWTGEIYTDAATQTTANMGIATETPTPFFGFVWEATTIRVFGPGTYTFETCPPPLTDSGGVLGWIASDGSTNCDPGGPGSNDLVMTVGPDQLGAHMLFNWNLTKNIDVGMVWDINAPWAGAPDGSNNFGAKGAIFNLSVIDSDSDGIPGQPMVDGPFGGFNANFNVNLNPIYALPTVDVTAQQDTNDPAALIVPGGGNVTLTANGSAYDNYDWSGSDPALLAANTNGTSSSTFVFDPSGLADGVFTAQVAVNNNGEPQGTDSLPLTVDSTATIGSAADTDGDGVPDSLDPAADPLTLLGQTGNTASFLVAADKGVVRLGDTARGLGVMAIELADTDFPADDTVTNACVGGCGDLEVAGLTPGDTVNIVIPQTNALPPDAVVRVFVNGAWRNFRGTGTAPGAATGDTVSVAAGGPGTCPAPGNGSYIPMSTADLSTGNIFCLQLSVRDGGLNDADFSADGVYRDPIGIGGGVVATGPGVSDIASPGTGGCSLASGAQPGKRLDWLLVGALISLLYLRRRQRSQA